MEKELERNVYILGRKLLYKELNSLWKRLDGYNYAVIKGDILSRQLKLINGDRKSCDIDILIERKNITLIEDELKQLGFKQLTSSEQKVLRANRILCLRYSHQISSYHKEKFGYHFNVDINFDIFWGEYGGKRCAIGEFLNDCEYENIYGQNVKVLKIAKAFVQLVLHHYKEMNSLYILASYHGIRTEKMKDIYLMLKNNKECLSANKVYELAHKYSIIPIMYYVLFYTHKVFNDKFLDEYLLLLESQEGRDLLDVYGLDEAERRKWNIPFEERLDNINLWNLISAGMNQEDRKKIMINESVFL